MRVKVPYLRHDPKTGMLRYRRVFPAELRPFLVDKYRGLTELKVTLKARSINEPGALALYQDTAALYDRLIERARKAAEGRFDELTDERINFITEAYRVLELAQDEVARFDPTVKANGEMLTRIMEEGGIDIPPHRPTARWSQSFRVAHGWALECYRALSADGDLDGILDAWGEQASALATRLGFNLDDRTAAFRTLCIRLNETAIATHEAQLQRVDGQVVPTPPVPKRPKGPASQPTAPQAAKGQTFDAIVRELIEKPRHGFKEPTKERVRGGLRFLVEALGDLRPQELTRERVTVFLDQLALRPAKLAKGEGEMPLPELVGRYADRPEVPRLTQKTLEAYNMALSARWKDAVQDGAIAVDLPNPFSERKFARGAGRKKTATGFSADELRAYFAMPPFASGARPVRGKGEAVYWIPLLLLFTGARPEEVAQLLVADLFQREGDGRWMIRFTNEGEHPVKGRQSLKTEGHESGVRAFPIPQPLLDLGLLRYRQALQDAGELALFPLLRRKGKRSGIFASFGEWMGPYVYEQGVLEPGTGRQPVREFRHTWSTAARASRIPKEAMKYIQGHKDEDDRSASDGYGDLKALGDRIEDFRLPVDILKLVRPWHPIAVD
ncbi:hypothetical protein [Novosphingobium sp. B1]|uniref:hypothetical protein n=1 Tax=Novosphingobium sp. B1 TaxID=1938756 RepID=UPI0009D7CD3B|nr:hypothetical protein [Novosphingobium sp. B1]SMC31062.1 hypothetical protein SAMN06272759_101299 [Novosphingobium sp. B1]